MLTSFNTIIFLKISSMISKLFQYFNIWQNFVQNVQKTKINLCPELYIYTFKLLPTEPWLTLIRTKLALYIYMEFKLYVGFYIHVKFKEICIVKIHILA